MVCCKSNWNSRIAWHICWFNCWRFFFFGKVAFTAELIKSIEWCYLYFVLNFNKCLFLIWEKNFFESINFSCLLFATANYSLIITFMKYILKHFDCLAVLWLNLNKSAKTSKKFFSSKLINYSCIWHQIQIQWVCSDRWLSKAWVIFSI